MGKIYPEKVNIAGDKIFNALCEDEIFADYTLKEREAAKAILFDVVPFVYFCLYTPRLRRWI